MPEDDHGERMVCAACGYDAYEKPKVEAGAAESVLRYRPAIDPRGSCWILPAAFPEIGETLHEVAARDSRESAKAHIDVDGIPGLFSTSRARPVRIMSRARFPARVSPPLFAAGADSLDARLHGCSDITWDAIAFPSTRWAPEAWNRGGAGPPGASAANRETRGMRAPGVSPAALG